MQGDAFIYYEHGMRFLGRSLANDDQEVVKHLSTLAPAEQNVAKSLLPYRDFECQYPPLAVHYFRMLAALSPNFDVFFLLLRTLNGICLIATVLCVYSCRSRLSLDSISRTVFCAEAALVVASFGPRWLCQYDYVAVFFLAASLAAVASERNALAGGLWCQAYC